VRLKYEIQVITAKCNPFAEDVAKLKEQIRRMDLKLLTVSKKANRFPLLKGKAKSALLIHV
jgi:hypothetical protein